MFGFSKDEKLTKAVKERRWGDASDLLRAGASPNHYAGPNPIHFFVWPHASEGVRSEWIEKGANLILTSTGEGKSAIGAAACTQRPEAVEFLIKHGANPNDQDDTGLSCLMAAAFLNDFKTIDILIKAGASVEAKDEEGFTALMFAAKQGALERFKHC